MSSALPGNSSPKTAVALTKVALRLFRLADVADAIGDLTGLGQANIEKLVRAAEKELVGRPSAEFSAVATADREWAEAVLSRTYIGLAADPARRVMSEGLIGAEAVAQLAADAMTADDRRQVDAASEDVRAYLSAVSESIAYLISEWYSTNEEPNRAAMSQAAGETLQSVRAIPALLEALKDHLDTSLSPVLAQLEQTQETSGPEAEQILFEVDSAFTPLATDAELSGLVSKAVIAVLEKRPLRVEVSLPTLDEELKEFDDPVAVAKLKRMFQDKARGFGLALSAFFSPQVEDAWGSYFAATSDRVTVVRGVLAGQEGTPAKLDVWRTTPPLASAPIWLTPEEIPPLLDSVQLGNWDFLRGGAGWRAANELPHSLIREKVMPSILAELVRRNVTTEDGWSANVLFLPTWHIGQG